MDHPDGIQAREAIALAKNRIQLTDFELGEYSNSSSVRFDKILRFSTIGPTKAGWMTKTKGIWRITEDGRTAYSAFGDPGDFMREASRLYLVWKRAQPSEDEVDSQSIDESVASATLEEAEEISLDGDPRISEANAAIRVPRFGSRAFDRNGLPRFVGSPSREGPWARHRCVYRSPRGRRPPNQDPGSPTQRLEDNFRRSEVLSRCLK